MAVSEVRCKLCGGKAIPQKDWFQHQRDEHPQEWADQHKRGTAKRIQAGIEHRREKSRERAAKKKAEREQLEAQLAAAQAANKDLTTGQPVFPVVQSEGDGGGASEAPTTSTRVPESPQNPPASVLENEPLEEVPEAKPSRNGKTKEPAGSTARLQFVARTIQVDARLLLFYNLSRQRFPEYVATEGEWLLDVVTRYYAEHAEDFGLDMSTTLQEVQAALLLEEE